MGVAVLVGGVALNSMGNTQPVMYATSLEARYSGHGVYPVEMLMNMLTVVFKSINNYTKGGRGKVEKLYISVIFQLLILL